MDKQRLIKILNLTTSDADGECLNAIRMANKLLKKENLTWDQVLSSDSSYTMTYGFSDSPANPFDIFREAAQQHREKYKPKGKTFEQKLTEVYYHYQESQEVADIFIKYHNTGGILSEKEKTFIRKAYETIEK